MEISHLPELEQISAPDVTASSCFHKLEVSEHISLLPCFVGRLSQGILEHLDKKLLRYSEQYGGVLLAYSKPSVQQTHGRILDEQPHIHFDLKYTAYVFRPVIDSIVCGTVNNVGGDHVGCLVYDCFNASVFARQLEKGRKRLNGLFSEFVIGSKIWFRVVSIENISGILSIVGEYFNISNLSQEEPISATHDNEIGVSLSLSQVDSSLELIAGSSENDEPFVNSGRSPKKKHKEKHSKKKKRKAECLAEFESGGGEGERETERTVKVPKKQKHKRKSKMSEEIKGQTVEESDSSGKKKKKSKKRKRSEDISSSETPKAKKLKITDDGTKLSSKKHKHKS
jgi:DNA-directed RNA polymerase subunit E'/Rpb7